MSHPQGTGRPVSQCIPACFEAPAKVEPAFQANLLNSEPNHRERVWVNGPDNQLAAVIKHVDERHVDMMRGVQELSCTLQKTVEAQNDRLERILEQLLARLHLPATEDMCGPDPKPDPNIEKQNTNLTSGGGSMPRNQSLVSITANNTLQHEKKMEHLKNFHLANRWRAFSQPWDDMEESDIEASEHESEANPSAKMAPWVRFVTSSKFDIVSGMLVLLNCVCMACELEYSGIRAHASLMNQPSPHSQALSASFTNAEHAFVGIFTVELILRMLAYGTKWFTRSNCLDFFVVFMSILENYAFASMGLHFPNVSALRLLRLTKLVKAVRIMRVMQAFRPLRVLVLTIGSSVGALGWSMILLTLLQFMTSIGMTQLMQDFVRDESQNREVREQVYSYFGRWTNSMLTMFEITVAPGGWAKVGRLIILQVNEWYALFFMVYVWVVTFAIIRVISAIFLSQTMAIAARDHDFTCHERIMKHDRDVLRLKAIFEEGDRDTGGSLSRREFEQVLKDSRVQAWLAQLELEVNEVRGLFLLLDDGDGNLSFEEFMSGIMRLRGGAKNVDLITLLYENKKIHMELIEIRDALGLPVNSTDGQDFKPPQVNKP